MTQPFTQKCIAELTITDLTQDQFLDIAIETGESLGWSIAHISDTGFTAYTNNGIFNWNAEVKIKLGDNDKANLLSQSRNIRSIEFGKDKLNLDTFISKFNELKKSVTTIELVPTYMEMQSNVA